jgi:hypothetical protein
MITFKYFMILITKEHFILMLKFFKENLESEFVLNLISSESFERNCV